MSTENDHKTCGDLYLEGLTEFTNDLKSYWAFAAGFVSGQAEKVYNGACLAAMFRPSAETYPALRDVLKKVCPRYQLFYTGSGQELWIFRSDREPEFGELFVRMLNTEENTATWHLLRAQLCGIPSQKIDYQYHARKNFNVKCD